MGREAKLLLGLLATLMGVFVGVLSMKLLVPRPPAGAGPDIHADVAASEPRDLVEPPPLASTRPAPHSVVDPPADPAPAESRDPFVSRAAFTATELDAPAAQAPPADPSRAATFPDRAPAAEPVAAAPPPRPGTAYVAAAGDSWWSLAETVYGDGRIYRALFAWNRSIDPRVSLVPGTPIDLPSRDRLEASWPALLPRP